MRTFLTGASGFVGGWLRRHLEEMGDEVFELEDGIDIGDRNALTLALSKCAPEVVYHLAALTHVGQSWEAPEETFRVNALGTLDLLESAREVTSPPRVLLVSSAEVYGSGDGNPIGEDAPLRPVTPYAASKVSAEFLGLQAHLGRGLDVVRARPFNHVGPGQGETFVVSALARRVAEAELSGATSISVGNLSASRDFTDVRDVVRAYRLLAEKGEAGGVYNVCSGVTTRISSLLEELVKLSKVPIVTEADPALFRPVDIPVLLGDPTRLVTLTGWRPEIALTSTLQDVLDEWRERLRVTAGNASS